MVMNGKDVIPPVLMAGARTEPGSAGGAGGAMLEPEQPEADCREATRRRSESLTACQ